MTTYEMRIVNMDNMVKTVYIKGRTFLDAISEMKRQYGMFWMVSSAKIIHVDP